MLAGPSTKPHAPATAAAARWLPVLPPGRSAASWRCGVLPFTPASSPCHLAGLTNRWQSRRSVTSSAAKAAAPSTDDNTLRPGAVIEFRKEGGERGILAFVLQPDGKKNFFVVDLVGRRSSILPKQVLYIVPTGGGSATFVQGDLARFAAVADNVDTALLELTHAVADGGGALTLEELCQLLFEEQKPHLMWATYKLLSQDKLYFKQVSDRPLKYAPNPSGAVEAGRLKQEAELRVSEERASFVAAFKAARSGKGPRVPREQWLAGPHGARVVALTEWINRPEYGVKDAEVLAQQALALDSLVLLGVRADTYEATQALMAAGALRLHEPMQLLRRRVALQHSAAVEDAAQASFAAPPADLDVGRREDLTHLSVFTIDNSTTTEVDDGVSVEELPGGGRRLWIHVADPTRYLTPSDVLDAEARRRCRTLYLPFGHLPMFPQILAAGPFSLRHKEVCDAMSVCVTLREDGALGDDFRIVASRVNVSHKMTYEEVDALLGMGEHCMHPELLALAQASRLRLQYRSSCGAIEILLPEAEPRLAAAADLDVAQPRITITCIDENSPARRLVSEMMVLAGEAAGKYGSLHQLALPYRGQDQPLLPPGEALEALPNERCRSYLLRKSMKRGVMAVKPLRHASLGIDNYVQFTSPIRRYTDLLAHYQIKAHLRGQVPPFTTTLMDDVVATVGERGRELMFAEKDTEQYWIAEFFRQRPERAWDVMVLGQFKDFADLMAVVVLEVGVETVVPFRKEQWGKVSPGDTAVVQLRDATPFTGQYRFTVVSCSSDLGAEEEEEEEGGKVALSLDEVSPSAPPVGQLVVDLAKEKALVAEDVALAA